MQPDAPPGSRYGDRRPCVVPDSLGELAGPTRGTVRLDPWLDWSGSPEYDLSDDGDLLVMYQTVLNQAATTDDLKRWLNGRILRQLWPIMWLPSRLRARWEARFSQLSSKSSRAAA